MAASRYTVQDGDTLHQIARRLLGNADQWLVLAQFNALDYPYIDTSGATYPGKTVLKAGSTLIVPSNISDKQEALALGLPDLYEFLLGRDLSLSADGDLEVNPSTGDLNTVGGIQNLLRALQHRLLTRKGELAYHPNYGSNIRQHLGQVMDAYRINLLRLEIVATLLSDPRIRAIANLVLSDSGDQLDIVVTALVIGVDDVTPLNLVIPKAA